MSTRIGRFGEETYVKPKDGETFETAISNINVGQAEIDKAVEKEAAKVEVKEEKPEPKKITSKTVFGDVVKLNDGRVGKVTGYTKKNRKTSGVVVNMWTARAKKYYLLTNRLKSVTARKL